jgi:hypothetical protein
MWNYCIDLRNFYHNDDLTIAQKGELMRFSLNLFVKNQPEISYKDVKYKTLDLLYEYDLDPKYFATVTDMDEFNSLMDRLYDLGDDYRIWICTA